VILCATSSGTTGVLAFILDEAFLLLVYLKTIALIGTIAIIIVHTNANVNNITILCCSVDSVNVVVETVT
jgi:hypothetical protein